ncbi:MAG: hypothetical protein KC503_33930 [Myxococcales bacterium]|nr:hypothetical protein [Myxococcales bacterium]
MGETILRPGVLLLVGPAQEPATLGFVRTSDRSLYTAGHACKVGQQVACAETPDVVVATVSAVLDEARNDLARLTPQADVRVDDFPLWRPMTPVLVDEASLAEYLGNEATAITGRSGRVAGTLCRELASDGTIVMDTDSFPTGGDSGSPVYVEEEYDLWLIGTLCSVVLSPQGNRIYLRHPADAMRKLG